MTNNDAPASSRPPAGSSLAASRPTTTPPEIARLPSGWWLAACSLGVAVGLLEAWLTRGHYLLDLLSRPAWTLLLANAYGFAFWCAALLGAIAFRLTGGRRWGVWLVPTMVAGLLGLILLGQAWVWHHHIWGSPDSRLATFAGYAVLCGAMSSSVFWIWRGLRRTARSSAREKGGLARLGVVLGFIVSGALVAFSLRSFAVDPNLRQLLFDRSHLTSHFFHLGYRFSDFDGDGFPPRWIGGEDPDNGDGAVHPLSSVEPWRPSKEKRGAAEAVPSGIAENANLLLITVDTLRADHLGAYGYERQTSPKIDRLAREGALFEQPVVQWTRTSQSVATLLTGTYSHTHGVINLFSVIPEDNVLLAEPFAEAGFATAGLVHNANLAPGFGFDQGFETYRHFAPDVPERRLTETALAWLEQHREERFFLWVHYIDPHGPYEPPEPFRGQLDHDEPLPFPRFLMNPSYRLPTKDLRDYIDRYDEEIREVDDEVGKLVEQVEAWGLRDRTLIVFTSDHGESFGHHFFGAHGEHAYESLVRVPLIFSMPGTLATDRRIAAQVRSLDIAPTILELFGLKASERVEGHSLAPFLFESSAADLATAPEEGYAFIESGYVSWLNPSWWQRAVRTEKWKYVWTPGLALHQLYDLENDPGELHNVYLEEPQAAARLSEVLRRWMRYSEESRVHREISTEELDDALRGELEALGYL